MLAGAITLMFSAGGYADDCAIWEDPTILCGYKCEFQSPTNPGDCVSDPDAEPWDYCFDEPAGNTCHEGEEHCCDPGGAF